MRNSITATFPQEMEPEIRSGALKMIVFEELVYQEALRRKMTVSAERLNRAETDFRQAVRHARRSINSSSIRSFKARNSYCARRSNARC
jgi:hypothetical protein